MPLEALDRHSPVPLYYQIQQRLLERIRLGTFKPGQMLPSELELAHQLGVSRMTGRHALRSLCDLGLTYTVQGKGTFVSRIKLAKDFRQVLSFTEEMQSRGMRPRAKVLEFKIARADDETASALHLKRHENVISLRRLRLANNTPMGIEWSRIPQRLCPDLLMRFDGRGSLYDALAQNYGIRIALTDEVIEAGLPGAREAGLLRATRRSPVFFFTRTSHVQSGEPVEFVKSIYRGDRYKIVNRLNRVDRELFAVGQSA